ATLEICEQVYVGPSQQLWGLYHMTGSGAVTWAEFASAIFAESEKNGGPSAQVLPIPSTDYPTLVERPKNSQLSTEKLTSTFGITLPEWQKSVARTVQRLLTEGDTSQ
ncbi:MAG: sugar nucleotide-binding protein, partial [Pseudomonadota bacterium]